MKTVEEHINFDVYSKGWGGSRMRASNSRKEGDIKVVGRRRKDKRDGID